MPRTLLSRRRFLAGSASAAVALAAAPAVARGGESVGRLRFRHAHTGERLDVVYREGERYIEDALAAIDRLMRDFRTGEIHPIDRGLLDLLNALRTRTDPEGEFWVISAYRSPATNEMLRSTTTGVARRSLHMDGRAIDVRLEGFRSDRLRDAARALAAGGVGYYQASDFVHLDTGRVRAW